MKSIVFCHCSENGSRIPQTQLLLLYFRRGQREGQDERRDGEDTPGQEHKGRANAFPEKSADSNSGHTWEGEHSENPSKTSDYRCQNKYQKLYSKILR